MSEVDWFVVGLLAFPSALCGIILICILLSWLFGDEE